MSPQAMTMRIGELSRRVGVSTHVLRAWESRYGLLRPVRSSGGYRLYGRADERRVRAVMALRDQGVAAAEACRTVLRAERLTPVTDSPTDPPPADELRLALTELLRCVRTFDEPGAHIVLDRLLAAMTFERFVRLALMPFLREIGEDWCAGSLSVAHEHFASQLVRQRLSALSLTWSSGTGPRALLACPPGERHDIALMTLGILLARRGWQVRFLGADTPMPDLELACRFLRPDLVVVSAASREILDDARPALAGISDHHRIAVGGKGVDADLVDSLGALHLPDDLVAAASRATELARAH